MNIKKHLPSSNTIAAIFLFAVVTLLYYTLNLSVFAQNRWIDAMLLSAAVFAGIGSVFFFLYIIHQLATKYDDWRKE